MLSLLSIPIFTIAYLFKGGQFNKFLPEKISGKLIAGIVVLFFALLSTDYIQAFITLAAWLLAVSPSMGEEAGAIGRYGHWWGKYKDRGFDRMYGVLKGVQRGAWMGAMFVVAGATTLSIPIMGLGFPLAHFIGQELYFQIHKKDDWVYAEFIIGSLIGLCCFLSF